MDTSHKLHLDPGLHDVCAVGIWGVNLAGHLVAIAADRCHEVTSVRPLQISCTVFSVRPHCPKSHTHVVFGKAEGRERERKKKIFPVMDTEGRDRA